MRQIILDTETTGLEPSEGHRIIEIGCIELINRKLTGRKYHQYINPQRAIDEGALEVHGISRTFLLDKPLFAEIAQEFLDFVRGAQLIIHNAPFDIGFIDHEFRLLADKKFKSITEECQLIDTLVMARQLHIGQRNSLDALCKRYGIDTSQRDLHGALLDASLLAQVYLAMTGGQGSLFDTTEANIEEAKQAEKKAVIASTLSELNQTIAGPLKVIRANAEELSAHREKYQF